MEVQSEQRRRSWRQLFAQTSRRCRIEGSQLHTIHCYRPSMMKLDNNEFLISKVVGGCLGGIGLSKDLHAAADTDSMQLKH